MKKRLKSYYQFLRKELNSDKNVYLIYTMGKVGSTSIYNSFQSHLPYADVFHTHFLSNHWLDKVLPSMNAAFHYNITHGKKLQAFLNKNQHRNIKIITLVREPVIRELSNLFQNWKHLYKDIEQENIEVLATRISNADYKYALEWFDTEFKNYLNIDLYNHPFDSQKGYSIYKFDKTEILCLKLEDLNNNWNQALTEFTGYNIDLITANTTNNKKGNQAYKDLKSTLSLPLPKLEEIYQSKYMQHFYTQKERDSFLTKWS